MHKPVLLQEILEIFDPKRGEKFIDATVNGGGHSRAILERVGEEGKVLGIDRDCDLIAYLEKTNRELKVNNFQTICSSYENIKSLAAKYNFTASFGILFDLGFSSYHIEESRRGFSFLKNEILDMRYDPSTGISAEEIVNGWPKNEIENILKVFGEERFARSIAKSIVEARALRRIHTTAELSEIILRGIPRRFRGRGIHPATRTFQALRIMVNRELEILGLALPSAIEVLKIGGKIAVISFHSLEDRIIKNFFKSQEKAGILKIITLKPIMASVAERDQNPRARSAKLRAAIKIQ